MGKRQSLFFIIVGTNGTGKTTLLNNILSKTNRDKVLVVEPEGLEWQHYKEISYDKILGFTKGKAKVINPSPEEIDIVAMKVINDDDGTRKLAVSRILETYGEEEIIE